MIFFSKNKKIYIELANQVNIQQLLFLTNKKFSYFKLLLRYFFYYITDNNKNKRNEIT